MFQLGPGTEPSNFYVEPESGVRPIVRALDRAQHSIMIEDYIMTDLRIIHALERAATQGVRVYVILERHPLGMGLQPVSLADKLLAAGCYVKWGHGFYLTHAKLLLLDDRLAIVSTANLSRSGFSRNREFIAFDPNRQDVRQLSSVFRDDWDHLHVSLRDMNVILSPVNARFSLDALVFSARHMLDVYAEELTDPALGRELARKQKLGVTVRVLVPAGAAARATASLGSLRGVVRVLVRPYAHAKAIVADNRIAFVGSENLSATSLDKNREFGLLVRGTSVRQIARTFRQDWTAARPPP